MNMKARNIKGAGLVFCGLSLAAIPALAQGSGQRDLQGAPESGVAPQQGSQQQQGNVGQQGSRPQQGAGSFGAGIGAQGQQPGQQGQQGYQQQQQGAQQAQGPYGQYSGIAQPISAPAPQFWLADASLFIGNAANAAHVLSLEENLNVQAPQVLADQAAFLIAATNRALTSLQQLEQNAQAQDPQAVAGIRGAIGQLVAAKAIATQAAESVSTGGPTFTTSVRAALTHLAAAEREMGSVGRVYNVPQFAMSNVCSASRGVAFGAGLGGKGGPHKQQPPAGQPQPQTPGGTPQPQPPGGTSTPPEKTQ